MFNLKIVRKDAIEVYENALEKSKEMIQKKDEVIQNLLKRVDELLEESNDFKSDAMKYRSMLRRIDNIILTKEKGITPTNKINQIFELMREE